MIRTEKAGNPTLHRGKTETLTNFRSPKGKIGLSSESVRTGSPASRPGTSHELFIPGNSKIADHLFIVKVVPGLICIGDSKRIIFPQVQAYDGINNSGENCNGPGEPVGTATIIFCGPSVLSASTAAIVV